MGTDCAPWVANLFLLYRFMKNMIKTNLILAKTFSNTMRYPRHDKQDDFNFKIVNFPYLSSNIPSGPANGVYISKLVRIGRICT